MTVKGSLRTIWRKWDDLEKIIRNTEENKVLGLNFKNPDPNVNIPSRNVFSYLWNFVNVTYQSLLLATDKDTRYTIMIDMGSILPFDVRYVFLPYKTKQMIEMGREAVRNYKPCHKVYYNRTSIINLILVVKQ